MCHELANSIKENRKLAKDFMIHQILVKFKYSDRLLIAKLMKDNYKEGFINGMKINQK